MDFNRISKAANEALPPRWLGAVLELPARWLFGARYVVSVTIERHGFRPTRHINLGRCKKAHIEAYVEQIRREGIYATRQYGTGKVVSVTYYSY